MKFLVKLIVTLAILAGAGGGYWYYYLRPVQSAPAAGAGGPPAGFALPVETTAVKSGTINRQIAAVGTLRSDESVMIRPEVAGRIGQIGFEEGKTIKKGAPIVTLDAAIARADLAAAKSSLVLSQQNWERSEELFRRGAGSAQTRDQAIAKLRNDEAQVQLAQAKLDKTVLLAPMSGVLGMRRVSAGDYVNAGQDIVNLEAVDPIKVDFRVPEIFFGAVKVGQKIDVRVDALPDRTFTGDIFAIDPQIDTEGRSIVIRARLPNGDDVLRPGLFARVTLILPKDRPAVLLPEQALVPVGSDQFVFKVVDGKAAFTKVKLGERRNAVVEVIDGLVAGDVVVVGGQIKIRNGQPVQAIPGPPTS